MTTHTASSTMQKRPVPFLPLVIALVAGFIQLASCGTPIVKVGVSIGIAVGVSAVVLGHVTLYRIKKGSFPGSRMAGFGLVAGYLSLLIIPIVGSGILLIVMGGGH